MTCLSQHPTVCFISISHFQSYLRSQEGNTLSRKVRYQKCFTVIWAAFVQYFQTDVANNMLQAGYCCVPSDQIDIKRQRLGCNSAKSVQMFLPWTLVLRIKINLNKYSVVYLGWLSPLSFKYMCLWFVLSVTAKPHTDNTTGFCHNTGNVVSSYIKKSVSLCRCKHILAHLAESSSRAFHITIDPP